MSTGADSVNPCIFWKEYSRPFSSCKPNYECTHIALHCCIKKNETELFLYEMVNYEQIFKRPVILPEMSEGDSSVPTFSFEQNISSKKQKIWSFDGLERTNT